MSVEEFFEKFQKSSNDFKDLINEGWKKLDNEKQELEKKKKEWDDQNKKLEKVHFPSKITLDIGGSRFTTSINTLQSDSNSFFGKMFSGKWKLKLEEDGSYFIDRDGTHFRYILNYLRTTELTIPDDPTIIKEITKEAEFFQLEGLLLELKSKFPQHGLFKGGTLLTTDHQKILSQWAGNVMKNWKLIYKATNNGFQASSFHQLCNNISPLYVIIQSDNNFLFGGYTTAPFTSSGSYCGNNQAFIFTLTNPYGIIPTKYGPSGNNSNFIYDDSSYGPIFGEGHDIYVCDSSGYDSDSSCINFPSTYQDTTGMGNNTFTGSRDFITSEIEIYTTS